MKRERVFVENRRKEILDKIVSTPGIRVEELAELFGVSAITIRRDLQFLEDQNLLTRYYGGASPKNQKHLPEEEDDEEMYRDMFARYVGTLVYDFYFVFIIMISIIPAGMHLAWFNISPVRMSQS